ncbi:alkyl hydroperoxide reductase [archaeon RBG_16_50_20]|nr:MAG: alkyl hydroperoxide reductase [archaeon RBG_16_50_20]
MANLKIGDKAISFKLPGVDDKVHSLDEYAGKNGLAVIFSCNHCPYVRAWEDRMVQIQADYAGKGIQLVAINANDDTKYPDDSFPKMKERSREKKFNYPYLRDETQEVARAYGAERTPEVFLFDKGLTLHYHGAIDDNYDNPSAVKEHYLRGALDAMLSGKPLSTSETKPVGCTVKWK